MQSDYLMFNQQCQTQRISIYSDMKLKKSSLKTSECLEIVPNKWQLIDKNNYFPLNWLFDYFSGNSIKALFLLLSDSEGSFSLLCFCRIQHTISNIATNCIGPLNNSSICTEKLPGNSSSVAALQPPTPPSHQLSRVNPKLARSVKLPCLVSSEATPNG